MISFSRSLGMDLRGKWHSEGITEEVALDDAVAGKPFAMFGTDAELQPILAILKAGSIPCTDATETSIPGRYRIGVNASGTDAASFAEKLQQRLAQARS